MLDRRLRWERRNSLSLCVIDRSLRWKRRHTRDIISCLLKGRSPRRCRIATTCYLSRLLRDGRLKYPEADGGETPLLLLLLLYLFELLDLVGVVTASWHG